MKQTGVILIFLFGITLAYAQNFNIVDYGAVADGKTLNTAAIQRAIDTAHAGNGGRVIIPNGTFLSGSILMKSGVELHLAAGAILLGSTNPKDYLKINRWKALVMADGQENISITGKGIIDGQGRMLALHLDSLYHIGEIDSMDYEHAEKRVKWYLRPQLIEFVSSKNIIVRQVTLRNASCWVQTHDLCTNIVIDSVTTISDAYWNNDGIDISDCKNVRITNCFVDSSDDGICLKSHSANHMCEDILIENCKVRSSASAVKFGTRSYGGFRNIEIRNIKVFDTFRSAIAIECVDGGILENVVIENIDAKNTGNAIFIRLGKRNPSADTSILRNVVLKNIRAEIAFGRPDEAYEIRGPALPFFHNIFPSSITGIPGQPVENVTMENIEIIYPGKGNEGLAHMPLWRLDAVPEQIADYPEFSMFGELPAWGFYVRHVHGLKMQNIRLHIADMDYRPAIVFDDVHHLEVTGLNIEGDEKPNKVILYRTTNERFEVSPDVTRWK